MERFPEEKSSRRPKTSKFPVLFPVSREFRRRRPVLQDCVHHHPLREFSEVSAIDCFRRVSVRLWSGEWEFRSLGGSSTALSAEIGALSLAGVFVFPWPLSTTSNRDLGSTWVSAVRSNATANLCDKSALTTANAFKHALLSRQASGAKIQVLV